jgi:hypothetical protein
MGQKYMSLEILLSKCDEDLHHADIAACLYTN